MNPLETIDSMTCRRGKHLAAMYWMILMDIVLLIGLLQIYLEVFPLVSALEGLIIYFGLGAITTMTYPHRKDWIHEWICSAFYKPMTYRLSGTYHPPIRKDYFSWEHLNR